MCTRVTPRMVSCQGAVVSALTSCRLLGQGTAPSGSPECCEARCMRPCLHAERRPQMVQSAAIARIVRHPIRDLESRESTALLVGGAAFVLGAIVGLLAFWGRNVPISGRGSIGDFVAIGGGVTAIAAFVAGAVLRRAQEHVPPPGAAERRRLRWYDIAALAVAHAVIALIGWAAIAALLS